MENNILIAGCSTKRGIKITKFLKNKGYTLFGVDRNTMAEPLVSRFFRMDMRHKDNMGLIMTIAKPTTLIFCPDIVGIVDYNYTAFAGVLNAGTDAGVKKIVLCLDDIYAQPKNPNEISQTSMNSLLSYSKIKHNLETLVITNKSNLLKEIKEFVKDGDNK